MTARRPPRRRPPRVPTPPRRRVRSRKAYKRDTVGKPQESAPAQLCHPASSQLVVRSRWDPADVLVLSRLGFPAIGRHRLFVTAIGIDALGSGVWMPLSVLYFIRVTHLSLVHVGVALSAAAALSFPLALVIGSLVDRFDAKRVLQGGNVLQAIGFACYPLAHGVLEVTLVVGIAALGRTAFWGS